MSPRPKVHAAMAVNAAADSCLMTLLLLPFLIALAPVRLVRERLRLRRNRRLHEGCMCHEGER